MVISPHQFASGRQAFPGRFKEPSKALNLIILINQAAYNGAYRSVFIELELKNQLFEWIFLRRNKIL